MRVQIQLTDQLADTEIKIDAIVHGHKEVERLIEYLKANSAALLGEGQEVLEDFFLKGTDDENNKVK